VLQADEKRRKSKERLEEEKRAILKQRIRPLDIDGADAARLVDKAKELLNLITRLESEKYDLEKSYKARQMEVSVGLGASVCVIVVSVKKVKVPYAMRSVNVRCSVLEHVGG